MPADSNRQGERLQKVMAHAGVASRRTCEEYIVAGRVKVNGRTVTELGTRVDPDGDLVEFDGQPVVAQEKRLAYYLLYKPTGYLSTVSDPHGRATAVSLVPGEERLYPVGRLDLDSEGLLLLTNDGALAHRLMHPRFQHEKEYLVAIQGNPTAEELQRLQDGIHIEDDEQERTRRLFVRARAEAAQPGRRWQDQLPTGCSWIRMVLQEGKKRQIRRMLDELGYPVTRLIRMRVGSLELGQLKPGQGRWLSKQEVQALRQDAGLGAATGGIKRGAFSARKGERMNTGQKDTTVEVERQPQDHDRHRRAGGLRQEHRRLRPRR